MHDCRTRLNTRVSNSFYCLMLAELYNNSVKYYLKKCLDYFMWVGNKNKYNLNIGI